MPLDGATSKQQSERHSTDQRSETELVRECLAGNEEAWSSVVERYKNLVYSIPLKNGITGDDASDIFQAVFFALLSHLGEIRNPKALPMWLMQTTSRKCQQFRKSQGRFAQFDDDALDIEDTASLIAAEEALGEWEREQSVASAMRQLSPRCQTMMQMLFFESPARPYEQVAKDLGLAVGSIGFIRARCLEKMRTLLEKVGL